MSVVGFDLSTNNIHAAFIPKDNIIYCDVKNITYDDVPYNDVKNRNNKDGTMAAVSFQGKRRFVGRYATSMNNHYSDIMKVIGRSKLDLQFDPQLSYLPERGPNAQLLCVPDLMPDICFTPTQLLAMVLSDLKSQAEIALRVDHVKECCIGIPAYFSESQCKAVRQAAQIAGFSNVSLVAAITATVLGHSIIRGQVIKQGIKVEKYIVIIDVDSDYMQIAVVSLKRQHLNVLTHVSHSSTGDVKVLLQNALTKANIKNDKIDKVLVTGSNIAAIESSLEDFFPKQEATANTKVAGAKVAGAKVAGAKVARTKVAGTKVDAAPDLVAKGCAILCAIRSESFKKHEFNHRLKSTQKFLVEFKVTDKWPPVSDEKTEVQVTQSSDDGRVVLTCQEMIDACTYESKMALREKLRMIIPAMLKLIEYATEAEVVELNNAKSQLDNDDLDDVYTNVRTIENNIRGRNDEHMGKLAMIAKLERKVVEIERKLISAEPIYRTIKQTMKNRVKQECEEAIKWLNKQKEILARLPKNEGPISFMQNTDNHIEYLELAFEAAMLEREPEIVKLTYTVTKETFLSTIDDFRTQLLKGTNAKVILGCFLLPFQIEVGGVPFKWFQVTLRGRGSESTVLHVKHHNAYIMGFNNKDGQPYEMAPGNQDDKELGHKDGDLNPPPMICFTIAGAKEAGFKCDYVNVVDPERKYSKDEVPKKMAEFMLGEDPWLNSIHVLHYHGSDPEHHKVCELCKAPYAVRRAFMCISVMLNECTRMDAMKEAVHAGFFGMKLEEYRVRYLWLWRVMSELLRRWDADNKTKVSPIVKQYTHARTIPEVADIMYLLLNACGPGKITKDQGSSSQTSASSGGGDGDNMEKGKKHAGPSSSTEPDRDGAKKEQSQTQVGPGQKLLQIFSVTPKRINMSDILGIQVHEDRCSHVIYSYGGENVSRRRHEFKLSGPNMAISSETGCILEVVPKTGNKFGATEDMIMYLDDGCSYNQPRLKTMPYGGGELLISYAILTEAVEANLKLELQLPPTGLTYNVSGLITVSQQNGFSYLSVVPAEHAPETVLGLPDLTPYMPVNIQLSRSILALKLGESVSVDGNLFIGDQPLTFSQVVDIPKEVYIIENVQTPWIHANAFSYRLRVTLTSTF